MAIPGCTTKYLILSLPPPPPSPPPHTHTEIVRETEIIWPPGKVGISLRKMEPNLSRTVYTEKLTERVSITGMFGVNWPIFDGVSWHIYIQPTNIFWNKSSLFQVVGKATI